MEAIFYLKKLQPKKYNYKDKILYGKNEVYGFLANEVAEVLPNAVTYETDYIPNIMTMCNIISVYQGTTELQLFDNKEHGLVRNDIIKMKTAHYSSIDNVKVLDVLSETKIIINYVFTTRETTFNDETDVIFLYGKLINDFNVLNKDSIFTTNVAATQELIRVMEEQTNKIKKLEKDYTNLVRVLGNNNITIDYPLEPFTVSVIGKDRFEELTPIEDVVEPVSPEPEEE